MSELRDQLLRQDMFILLRRIRRLCGRTVRFRLLREAIEFLKQPFLVEALLVPVKDYRQRLDPRA